MDSSIIRTTPASVVSEDPFEGNVEATVFMSDNRMPVMIEFSNTIIYIIFASLVLALLFILPGVRKTKFVSFISLLSLLTIGASILLAIEGSYWLTGSVALNQVPYSSLTSDLISGKQEIYVGLKSVNVSLVGELDGASSLASAVNEEDLPSFSQQSVNYNEKFKWDSPSEMSEEHLKALKRGLPYPILTVTEFLSQDSDGFIWSRQLRLAGYYCSLILYLSLVSWILTTIIICVLPIYLPHMLQITGALMMLAVWIYTLLVGSPKSFAFQIGGSSIEFAFGLNYVQTFIVGAISMFFGLILLAIQISAPSCKQFTIMDSELYLKDQEALYHSNIIRSLHEQQLDKKKPVLERSESVIIPINDIEESFRKA